jgi:hypothetical protein
MNQTDFSQLPLRDIHLPGPVAWWPPAPGWWALAALVLAGLVLFGLYYYRGRHARAARKALRQTRAALEQGAEPVVCLQHVSTVLRRFAMTRAAQSRHGETSSVPGLIGESWLHYLDSCWQRGGFADELGHKLLAAPYARPGSIDRNDALALTALCADWLAAQRKRRIVHAAPIASGS